MSPAPARSAVSAPMVLRLRPSWLVSSAREVSPLTWTYRRSAPRFWRRTESWVGVLRWGLVDTGWSLRRKPGVKQPWVPGTVFRGPTTSVAYGYLVSGDSFGSLAYASAALAFVTMTGASRKDGMIFE